MIADFDVIKRIADRNEEGKKAEESADIDTAIRAYEENIKEAYADAFAYNRLMIIYRKQKRTKDELRVIRRGIKIFSEQQESKLKGVNATRKNRKQVVELSNAFMSKAGLKDKKGNKTFYPEPINKWMNRMLLVEKKLKTGRKK